MEATVYVFSLHSLAGQILTKIVASIGCETRMLNPLETAIPKQEGELLVLDGHCNDAWPKVALQWQQNCGRTLIVMDSNSAHPSNQLRALFLGISGLVTSSSEWQNEIVQAVKTILSGKLWICPEVLEKYAQRTGASRSSRSHQPRTAPCLTAREEQIMSLLIHGACNKEIGTALGISERTVKFHVSNILQKSQVSSRRELTEFKRADDPMGAGARIWNQDEATC